MSNVRFEPIAMQISKLVLLEALLPVDVIERMRQGRPAQLPNEAPFAREVDEFMLHYKAAVKAAFQLLGAPQFERLSRLQAQIEKDFVPGGPPMSPVYDSYAAQHILAEIPQAPANETPYSVLARLTGVEPARERLHRLARTLADSHFDLYRVTHAENSSAQIEAVRSGQALSVRLTGPFLRAGDRMLARVLAFEGQYFIADSPYLLAASEQQWLDYLERSGAASAGTASAEKRAPARANLSSKQRARLRQRKKAAASSNAPDAAIARHLKFGRSERYWLNFIMDGYAGERNGIVRLAGIPDQPRSLPHHDDYEPDAEA